jgi:hypothetical protein
MIDPVILEDPIIKDWIHSTMEMRMDCKIHNFTFSYAHSRIFQNYIEFRCSGDTYDEEDRFAMTDKIMVRTEDLPMRVRDYKIYRIIGK